MSALLRLDETLTIGVNVIVRPGEPDHLNHLLDMTALFVAPQDWVALTGACPQPSAAYAMTICSRCGHMRLSWDSPCHCPVTVPLVSWLATCDWGDCDKPTARWRFDDDEHGWLPVCNEHGRRIVPLYRECPDAFRRHVPPCDTCDNTGQVLVGRGSIEVVPVIYQGHFDTGDRPCVMVENANSDKAWLVGSQLGDASERGSRQAGGGLSADRSARQPLTLDATPVPGRDFGIVIDCVKLAE